MIRLYDVERHPHRFPKLLTAINCFLEYVKQWMEVDELHFLKFMIMGRNHFPIFMGGYAINDKKAIEWVEFTLKEIGMKLYFPWKYDP